MCCSIYTYLWIPQISFCCFFLVYLLFILSIIESRVLKSSPIIVELSISPFNSVSFVLSFLLEFWDSIVRCICVYNCYIFLVDWPFYHNKLSIIISSNIFFLKVYLFLCYINIAFLALLKLLFTHIFFHHLSSTYLCLWT